MNIFEIARARPWLITPEFLRTILEITARENIITPELLDKIDSRREAVATRKGRRLDEARYTEKRENGVAVLDINGPIVRYADFFSEVSGGVSTQHIATDFRAALEDPGVKAIVLNIDSPGGEATGIHELGEIIYAARGRKPIVAYAEGYAASAAYWLASAADEIVADKTAMLGSIGVVFAVPDPTKRTAREIEIISTQSPKKRSDPTTEAGRSELQRLADEMASVFVDTVARNRNKQDAPVNAETVLTTFGQGGMRIGQDAVDNKMADRLGSLEELISELGRPRVAAVPINNKQKGEGSMSDTKKAEDLEKTTEADIQELAAAHEAQRVAMQAQIDELTKLAKANEDRAREAELQKLTTEANAKVDGWEREGKISGNGTAKVRAVYVAIATKQAVTTAMIEEMVAALPKFDTTRVSEKAKETTTTDTKPSRDEWLAHERGDRASKAKVDTFVKSLVAANPKKSYIQHLTEARMEAFAN